jgi:predicted phosphodiesterase
VKRALISDIHGNWEALQAVYEDIQSQQISRIVCLGDIVGYGPDPVACLDFVIENCELTILGNHDQATLFDPDHFNPVALKAIYWTRAQLEKGIGVDEAVDQRWEFLGGLPRRHDEGSILFVHGSPRDPTNEYVFPENIYESHKMDALFTRIEQYCFQGHTHMPGVFIERGEFLTPEDCNYEYPLDERKAMINVGSVGQPRDGDPRACYVILDEQKKAVIYRRVKYDVQKTRDKIYGISELDNMLGDRLIAGR